MKTYEILFAFRCKAFTCPDCIRLARVLSLHVDRRPDLLFFMFRVIVVYTTPHAHTGEASVPSYAHSPGLLSIPLARCVLHQTPSLCRGSMLGVYVGDVARC